MKKNLWYQLAIMMAVVLSIGLVACGDDDDEVNNSGSGDLPSKVSNSVLSSRLKDKYGNPVYLKGTSGGQVKYEYDENWALTYYESDNFKCTVDGLKIVAIEMARNDAHHEYEFHVTLGENGLITIMAASWKNYDDAGGCTLTTGDMYFSYNDQNQLVETTYANPVVEKYDAAGNLLNRQELNNQTTTYTWVDGNPIGRSRSYGTEVNVTKQNISACTYFEGPQEGLYMLGLFGVGSANFPDTSTFTVNENGTVATENRGSYVYY